MQLNHNHCFVLNDFILKNTMCSVMLTNCNTDTLNQNLYLTQWSASHAIKYVPVMKHSHFNCFIVISLHCMAQILVHWTTSTFTVFLHTWQHTLVTQLEDTEVRPQPYWNWMGFATDFSGLRVSPWISIYECIVCGHCNPWTTSLACNWNMEWKNKKQNQKRVC